MIGSTTDAVGCPHARALTSVARELVPLPVRETRNHHTPHHEALPSYEASSSAWQSVYTHIYTHTS
jgi:hypothetical protein